MVKRGRYVVWEGSDGIGKSTQMRLAVQESIQRGIPTIAVREPGDSSIGREVRNILLNPDTGDLHPMAENNLFLADRVQLWYGKIGVALAEGNDVYSDRNWWSGMTYQGMGGKISSDTIIQLHQLCLPEEYLKPDIGFVFHMTEAERRARKASASNEEFGTPDRIEQKSDAYFERAEEGYLYIRQHHGGIGINASGSIDEVASRWRPYLFPN